jgi:hypothetical protein
VFEIERVDGNEEVEERITFPAEQWEDVKRMGDAALAAYREKFPGAGEEMQHP